MLELNNQPTEATQLLSNEQTLEVIEFIRFCQKKEQTKQELKLAKYSNSQCNSPTNFFAGKKQPSILIDEE